MCYARAQAHPRSVGLSRQIGARSREENRLWAETPPGTELDGHHGAGVADRIRAHGDIGHDQRVGQAAAADHEIHSGDALEALVLLRRSDGAKPRIADVSVDTEGIEGSRREGGQVNVRAL